MALPTSVRLSTGSAGARAAFETAVGLFAAHKPGVADAIAVALAADPRCLAALALDGFMQILLARRETRLAARRRHAEILATLELVSATPAETALIEALGLAADDRLLKAATRLEAWLETEPRDFLGVKLAHALRFIAGDERGMLRATARALPRWSAETPGFGYLLGCHAFGLGEAGRLQEAEAAGRRAVELAPDDAWGLHAVAHVHETRGLIQTGVKWLEESRPVWSRCNNFGYHMAWHLALFHLERGASAEALAIYDADVRPVQTDDFRDIANATSMLWRLAQQGVEVDSRWDELHDIAARRLDDTTLVFASLHHLLTCLACDDRQGAARIAGNLEQIRWSGSGDQAETAASVGASLARALCARDAGALARFDVEAIARDLPRIGGSNAQRDVFLRTLALVAAQGADSATLTHVLGARHGQRPPDWIARTSISIHAARAAIPRHQVA